MNYYITSDNRLGKEYASTNNSDYVNLLFEGKGDLHKNIPCGVFRKEFLIKVVNYDKDTLINTDSGILYDKGTLKIVGQHNS